MGERSAMDSTTKQERKVELTSQLAAQRQALLTSCDGLRTEMSVSTLLKNSVRNHPIPWFAGSLGSAALLSLLSRRPSASEKRRGPIGMLLGLGFSLAKPALIKWGVARLKSEFENYLARQNEEGRQSANSKLGEGF